MGATQNANANGIHIFLKGSVYHHFRGLAQAGVDHFHAGITKGGSNHFGAAVVPVESYLGY
jgi:hypothetical protein